MSQMPKDVSIKSVVTLGNLRLDNLQSGFWTVRQAGNGPQFWATHDSLQDDWQQAKWVFFDVIESDGQTLRFHDEHGAPVWQVTPPAGTHALAVSFVDGKQAAIALDANADKAGRLSYADPQIGFVQACTRGELLRLKHMAEICKIDVNKPDIPDSSMPSYPLFSAAAAGHAEVVRWLLKQGANVEAINGISPLDLALHNNHQDVAEVLVQAGATSLKKPPTLEPPSRQTDSVTIKSGIYAGMDAKRQNGKILVTLFRRWREVAVAEIDLA